MKNDVLDKLFSIAKSKLDVLPKDALTVRGVWNIQYAINLTSNPKSPILNLGYVVVQTINQGCSYYEKTQEDPGINEKFIGRNIFEMSADYWPLEIAGLDAVYSHIIDPPLRVHTIDGSNIQKTVSRANIVVEESLSILKNKIPKKGNKFLVVNVGVVGPFLELLARRNDLIVKATDFYRGVVGRNYHGVDVLHGSLTNQIIAESDLAIITGMTLANDTLDGILKVARENNTHLAMFAETGANFACEYCKLGIDIVVSEPLPFYLTGQGKTELKIYKME